MNHSDTPDLLYNDAIVTDANVKNKKKCRDCKSKELHTSIRCAACAHRHNEGNRRRRRLKKQKLDAEQSSDSGSDNGSTPSPSGVDCTTVTPTNVAPTNAAPTTVAPTNVARTNVALTNVAPILYTSAWKVIDANVVPNESFETPNVQNDSLSECAENKKISLPDDKKILSQIAKNVNTRVSHALKSQLHRHETTEQLLGCSLLEYKIFLEKQFQPGMTWSNWGRWSVDHIVPVSSVNLCDPLARSKVFHYKNTRPVWTDENLKKSCKTLSDNATSVHFNDSIIIVHNISALDRLIDHYGSE